MTFEYNVNKNTIEENGEFVAYLNSVDGFRIANKLTALEKENEQLKSTIAQLIEQNRKNNDLLLSDIRILEKALIILEKSTNAFNECQKQLNETGKAFLECKRALDSATTYLKRVLNEEENEGNIHKDCKYYNSEKDYCRNYMLGRYTKLAFEVSRHKKCIDDMRKEGDV